MNDVDRLLALEDIKQLKARYWRFMDEKKWDEFQSVFTDNVVFDLREALFARDWHTSPAETYAGGNDANVLYDPKSGDMLFTQDQINAILSPNNPAAGGWYVVGAQNVRNWEQGILDQQPGGPWVTVHHGHTPEITIDSPTTAHGIWRLEHTLRVPRQNPYASNPYYFWLPDNLPYHEYHGFGIYFETYVKTADGWKIASLKLEHFRVDIK